MRFRGTSFYLTVLVTFVSIIVLILVMTAKPITKIRDNQTKHQQELQQALEILDGVTSDEASLVIEEEIIEEELIPAGSPFDQ